MSYQLPACGTRRPLGIHRRFRFVAILAIFCMVMARPAAAQSASSFTAGVSNSNGTVTIWFTSNVSSTWVDAHYYVNNGAQLNVTMNSSGGSSFTCPVSANPGDTVNYEFTYNNGGSAYNSAWASATVPASGSSAGTVATPSISPAGANYTSAQMVTLTDSTAGASIYYTTNGSTPTASSTLYTGAFTVSSSCTVNAIAAENGMSNSAVAVATFTIATSASSFTQGVLDNGSSVTIWFDPTPSASSVIVHYTANGGAQQNTAMTLGSNGQWTQSISATAGTAMSLAYSFTYTVAAAADTQSYTWSRAVQVAPPTISPNGGALSSPPSVTLADSTAGASIYYTTNGSTPTTSSTLYSGPFTLPASATVQAIAAEAGVSNSSVTTATFTINLPQAAAPTISPNGGSFTSPKSVTLSDSTPGASIYYTTNGSTPSTSSTLYTGPFTVSASSTVSAVAVGSGYGSSPVASAAFVICAPAAATPTFTPAGGAYTSAQTVTLSTATSGASIYYTLNGSPPTSSSALYTEPIPVSATETVNAIAIESGYGNSSMGSASYTINSGAAGFAYGVTESGATAYIWFEPNWTPSTAIVHYYVSSNGVNGTENDVNMTYNASLNQWVSPTISPTAAGEVVNYSFTYSQSTGGNVNSASYTYTVCGNSSMCAGQVPSPIISLASGVYPTPQTVTISLASTAPAGSTIYYTTDGSTPTTNSGIYTSPLAVSTAETLSAIIVEPSKMQSNAATATYDIAPPSGTTTVAPPTFSIPAGTYNTMIGVNLMTATMGATVYYTVNGSTPTASSPNFYGAIWLSNGTTGPTTTIKAIAILNGVSSPVSSATYTITSNNQSAWNGNTTFNIVNGTHGEYSNNQIYWQIIGIDWNTGNYVHVNMNGTLVPMSLGDDTIAVPNRTTDYADYAYTLAQASSVTIPPIESARMYLSFGSPVLIQVNQNAAGQIGYAGPDLDNSTDPNLDVTFDFCEFDINQQAPLSTMPGIFVNTSRVDMFGFPIQLNVTGLDGYNATVGEPLTETRAQIMARFLLNMPSAFQGLAQAPYAPYRIVAPAHASFNNGIDVATGSQTQPAGANATYLDAYIASVWNQLKTTPITLNLNNGWPTFTGSVGANNVLTFTDGQGSYVINGMPTTTEVLLGNGVLNDATGLTPQSTPYLKQLQLQAQVCAALNRHVADQPGSDWWNSAYFYPTGSTANYYAQFWHEHSIDGLAYGFAYDDVGGYSPSIYTPSPTSVTFTIGQ